MLLPAEIPGAPGKADRTFAAVNVPEYAAYGQYLTGVRVRTVLGKGADTHALRGVDNATVTYVHCHVGYLQRAPAPRRRPVKDQVPRKHRLRPDRHRLTAQHLLAGISWQENSTLKICEPHQSAAVKAVRAHSAPDIGNSVVTAGRCGKGFAVSRSAGRPGLKISKIRSLNPGIFPVRQQDLDPVLAFAGALADKTSGAQVADPRGLFGRAFVSEDPVLRANPLRGGKVTVLFLLAHVSQREVVGPGHVRLRSADLAPVAIGVEHLHHGTHKCLSLIA